MLLLLLLAGGCAACREPLAPPDSFILRDAEAAPMAKDHLVAATYNVHWLATPNRIHRELAALGDVDVWCLQEIRFGEVAFEGDAAQARSVLESLLPSGRWYAAVIRVNRLRELHSTDWEAQVIAARYPMDGVEVWELDAAGPKRRAALAARITVGERVILVVNTDHEPSFLALRDGNARQVAELRTRLMKTPERYALVAGDFNCSGRFLGGYGNSRHIRRLDRAFNGAALIAAEAPGSTFRSWPLSLRLDRIYARGLTIIDSKVERGCGGSDHRAVWCMAELSRPLGAGGDIVSRSQEGE